MSVGVPQPAATPASGQVDIYSDQVDPNQLLTPEQRQHYSQHALTPFSTGGAIVLSIFLGTLFSTIYYFIQNDKLPAVKPDDPSSGKAIGFMFIPFYNLYWAFFAWHRIVDRINFQYKLRGQPSPIPRGQVTTLLILSFIPLLGWIPAYVLWLMLTAKTQDAINGLAEGRV